MREAGELYKRLGGSDRAKAAGYINVARTLLGRMKAYLGAGVSGSKQWVLRDGTKIVTSVMGTIERVSIVAAAGGCKPLPDPLLGIMFIPSTDENFWGFRDLLTPDAEHPDVPYVIVTGVSEDSETSELLPDLKFYNKYHKPESIKGDFFSKKLIDTCGNKVPRAVPVVGTLDWRHEKLGVLTWTGASNRYANIQRDPSTFNTLRQYIPGHRFINRPSGALFMTGKVNPAAPNRVPGNLSGYLIADFTDTALMHNGVTVIVSSSNRINGAALKEVELNDGTKKTKIVYVRQVLSGSNVIDQFLVGDFNNKSHEATNVVVVASRTWPRDLTVDQNKILTNSSCWRFNDSCTEAITDRVLTAPDYFDHTHITASLLWTGESVSINITEGEPLYTLVEGAHGQWDDTRIYKDFIGDDIVTWELKKTTELVSGNPEEIGEFIYDVTIEIKKDGNTVYSRNGLAGGFNGEIESTGRMGACLVHGDFRFGSAAFAVNMQGFNLEPEGVTESVIIHNDEIVYSEEVPGGSSAWYYNTSIHSIELGLRTATDHENGSYTGGRFAAKQLPDGLLCISCIENFKLSDADDFCTTVCTYHPNVGSFVELDLAAATGIEGSNPKFNRLVFLG